MDKPHLEVSSNKIRSIQLYPFQLSSIKQNCEEIKQTSRQGPCFNHKLKQQKSRCSPLKSIQPHFIDIIQDNSPIQTQQKQISTLVHLSHQTQPQCHIKRFPNFYECPICQGKESVRCLACHGKQYSKEINPLINFFQAILKFKLGAKDQNNINFRRRCKTAYPQYKNPNFPNKEEKLGRGRRMTVVQRRDLCQNIHYGYYCNLCNNMCPIIGSKFTCSICPEYDLCQKCYFHKGHKHHMTQLAKSPSFECTLRCLQQPLFYKPQINCQTKNNLSVRSSICNIII